MPINLIEIINNAIDVKINSNPKIQYQSLFSFNFNFNKKRSSFFDFLGISGNVYKRPRQFSAQTRPSKEGIKNKSF